MNDYTLNIRIKGTDEGAVRSLQNVRNALDNAMQISMGMLFARAIENITGWLRTLAGEALNAAGYIQGMQVALETLVARELVRGEVEKVATQQRISLSAKEREQLENARVQYALLDARIQEHRERIRQLSNNFTEFGLNVATARAELASMLERQDDYAQTITRLEAKQGSLQTVIKEVVTNAMDYTDALAAAPPKVRELLDELKVMSLLSPFQYQQIVDMFRLQLALGGTVDVSMGLTKSMADTAAALNLSSDMVHRLAYNLGQAIFAGDLTMVNMRQLKLVGLDFAAVIDEELGMSLKQLKQNLDSGRITAEEVARAFMRYTDKYFGTAAERLAKTFIGLKSNIKDVLFFVGADLLTPVLIRLTAWTSTFYDDVIAFLQSGALERLGERLADAFSALIDRDFVGVAELIGFTPEFAELLVNIGGALRDIVVIIYTKLVAALNWARTEGLEPLSPVLERVNEQWEIFRSAIIGIGMAFTAVSFVTTLASIVRLINPLYLAIAGIGAVIGIAKYAWDTNWYGFRDTVQGVVGEILKYFEPLAGLDDELLGVWETLKTQGFEAAILELIDVLEGPTGELLGGAFETFGGIVEIGLGLVAGHFEKQWGRVEKVWDLMGQFVEDIKGGMGLGEALEKFGEGLLKEEVVGKVGAKIASWAGKVWAKIQPELEELWQNVKDEIPNIWDLFVEKLTDLTLGEIDWDPIFEKIATAIGEAWTVIQLALESLWETIREEFGPTIDEVGEALEEFRPTLEAFGEMLDELAEAFGPMAKVAAITLSLIISAISGMVTGLLRALAPFMRLLAHGLENIFDVIADSIRAFTDLFAIFLTFITGDEAERAAKWESLQINILNFWTNFLELIGDLMRDAFITVGEGAGGFVDGVVGWFYQMWNKLMGGDYPAQAPTGVLPRMLTLIAKTFANLPAVIVLYMAEKWTVFVTTLADKFLEIPTVLNEKLTEIWEDLQVVGIGIVLGIIEGIMMAGPELNTALTLFLMSLPEVIKKALGIESPAKVFIPFGELIVGGLALGFQRGFRKFTREVSGSLGGMSTGLNFALGPGGVGASYSRSVAFVGGDRHYYNIHSRETHALAVRAARAMRNTRARGALASAGVIG